MDKEYPRYRFTSKWLQANEEGRDYDFGIQEAPEGYHWDTSGITIMYRTEPTREELMETVRKHVEAIKNKYPVVGEVAVTYRRLEDATWCIVWFSHYTFDEGQSDKDVLESFERFVRKHSDALMGADERWRWKGFEGGPAPCRCDGCKQTGRIFINH